MAKQPAPFRYDATDDDLDDLRRRLSRTRLPASFGAGWDYGIDWAYLADLLDAWASDFDWRSHERRINALPNFTVELGGRPVHFVHLSSPAPGAIPLVMTHGWPSSFLEMLDVLPLLTSPGSTPTDAAVTFDVVVPSMPGFGFSPAPVADGRTPFELADLWVELMRDVLGYRRFIAHGGDIGADVTIELARRHPDAVLGIHLTTDWADDRLARASNEPEDRDYVRRVRAWEREESAYGHIQGTKPQTLAIGLNDSPAGLAAWIVEKWRAWSDRRGTERGVFSADQLLATATLYWLTGSIGSSFLPYYRHRHTPRRRPVAGVLPTPTGIARLPGDEPGSPRRSVAARQFNVVHWTDMPRGGHFAAIEVPDLLAADLKAFAGALDL
jgi:pimeloyl-ACP methyl ester carboxylesterase